MACHHFKQFGVRESAKLEVAPVTKLGYEKMNETSELKQFCDDVLTEFQNNITDAVFCYLQSDKDLMRRYLALMRDFGRGKQTLNSQLAQAITREFGLKSTKRIKETPNSVLIESFSELEVK